MYRTEKIKRIILTAALAIVIAVFVGGVGYFGYLMTLRTDWKNDRLALADHFSQAYRTEQAYMAHGGERTEIDSYVLDHYLDFLLSGDTVVLRKETPELTDTLDLILPGAIVHFMPMGDGIDTNIQWRSNNKTYGYTVHGVVAYKHLLQFYENIKSQEGK